MTEEQTITDLLPSNGQIPSKAYIYKVKKDNDLTSPYMYVTVVATNSTSAKAGLTQQFPSHIMNFIGVCDHIMQVNG